MSLWSCRANECAHVSAGASNAGAIIGACDGASVVILHGESVIHDNVVPVQKFNMLFCVDYFLEWKAYIEHHIRLHVGSTYS